jgi:hypothetical protein
MPAHRKASIRELSTAAYELGSGIVKGRLHRDLGTGAWMVGEKRLDRWLDTYDNQEIVLIVASFDDERPLPIKVCRTCGTEYRSFDCPRCRRARIRLRGR